jgi:hypothetical protein
MTCVNILVVEGVGGWFVMGPSSAGPFISKERAVHLAEGMVCAIRMSGDPAALLVLEGKAWPSAVLALPGPAAAGPPPPVAPEPNPPILPAGSAGGLPIA